MYLGVHWEPPLRQPGGWPAIHPKAEIWWVLPSLPPYFWLVYLLAFSAAVRWTNPRPCAVVEAVGQSMKGFIALIKERVMWEPEIRDYHLRLLI